MKTVKILALGLLVLGLGLGAKSATRETSCRTRAETFLAAVSEVKVLEAYDRLLDNSPLKKKAKAVDDLKEQTSTLLGLLGKPFAFELVKEQRYGDSVVRVVYIQKFDVGPIMWEFYFYKPHTDWVLINLEFNDKLALLGDK